MKHHPEVVAKFCHDTFPCTTSKLDTVTSIEYDFIELKCPGYDYDNSFIDTVWLTHSKTQLIEGPAIVVTENRINNITKSVKDSAAIKVCEYKCDQLKQENNILNRKVSRKNKWITWLIIAFLLSIIGNLLQLKK